MWSLVTPTGKSIESFEKDANKLSKHSSLNYDVFWLIIYTLWQTIQEPCLRHAWFSSVFHFLFKLFTKNNWIKGGCRILNTNSLVLSGIDLIFKPRQDLFPEGLPEGNSLCQGYSTHRNKCFIILMSLFWISIHYNHTDFSWRWNLELFSITDALITLNTP